MDRRRPPPSRQRHPHQPAARGGPQRRSATRRFPRTAAEGPLKERLKSGSLDVVLNAASVMREVARTSATGTASSR